MAGIGPVGDMARGREMAAAVTAWVVHEPKPCIRDEV